MRIALLQIRLNHKSRASNLQTLKRAIVAAVNVTDAPDLIVLPGACDNGGAASSRGCCRSALEGVRESLAWLAREWGVYIAAGLHAEHEGVWEPCAVLLDPDGDVVAASEGRRDDAPKDVQISSPAALCVCPTGNLGVFEPTSPGPLTERIGSDECAAVFAVPVAGILTARQRRAVEANLSNLCDGSAQSRNVYLAVVTEAGKPVGTQADRERFTFLLSPGGEIVAEAGSPEETIVRANVVLPAV